MKLSAFFAPLLLSLGGVACSGSSPSASPSRGTDPSPGAPDGGPTSDAAPGFDAGVPIERASASRDAPSPAPLAGAVTANNAFALTLYGKVAPTANGGNLITSPLSASLALTMLYAGAQGQTASEMASALSLPADASAVFDGENALSQALAGRAAAALAYDQGQVWQGKPDPSDYALQVVNSVWGQETYTWAAPFLDVLARSYGTGVYLEDFVSDATGATQTINSWVSFQTADKISGLLPPGALTSDTRMVLVNAVHLKLPWASPFQVAQTASAPFTRGDGSQVTASFMHQGFETASYVETDQAQVLSLPLSGNQLSVVIALPKNGLASLVSSLTPQTWAAMTSAGSQDVLLSLPKFSFTTQSFSLAKPLQALGMKTAFDPAQANFKGLCASPPDGNNLYVSDVLQKAMMAVSESGVEAAAATAVVNAGTAAPSSFVTLTIDHPFLVSIVDSSGAIVFMGQIDDPTNAGSP
jgi:serpin B